MTGGDLVSGSPLSKTIAELEAKVAADGQDIDALNLALLHRHQRGGLGRGHGLAGQGPRGRGSIPRFAPMAILQASVGMGARAKTELDSVLAEAPRSVRRCCGRG